MIRWALGLVGAALVVIAVLVVRDATLSVHAPVPTDSRLEVVVHADSNGAEPGQTLGEMTQAQLLVCRLEVSSDPIGGVESLDDDRFRFVLQPSLDDTDQKQFRGCLEDFVIDHFRMDVEEMVEL